MKKLYPLSVFVFLSFFTNAQLTSLKSGIPVNVDPTKEAAGGASLNTRVIFVNMTTGQAGSTDGTVAGTVDIPASTVILAGGASALQGKIVFAGTNGTGIQLWTSDGTVANTSMLADATALAGGTPTGYVGDGDGFPIAGSTLFFFVNSTKLWKTDGTVAGTSLVKDVGGAITIPFTMNLGNNLYFTVGKQLWVSDGTSAGTVMVKDFTSSATTTFSKTFFQIGSIVYFLANDGTHGLELWKTDGTTAGTTELTDFNGSADGLSLYTGNSIPDWNAYTFGSNLYFTASLSGAKIFKSGGTVASTVQVIDLNPGCSGCGMNVNQSVTIGSNFYFSAFNSVYKTDGTAAGTQLVKSLGATGSPTILTPKENLGSGYSSGTFNGGRFFFIGDDGTNGKELWVSDGTNANTFMLKNINPSGDAFSGNNDEYYYTKYTLYFAANNGTNGVEVWQTDGTTVGTTMVQDVYAGANSSYPHFAGVATATNKMVLFAQNNASGVSMYSTTATTIPFPLSLTDFTAQLKGAEVALNWTTQNEIAVVNFNVQRSITGKDFLSIAKVNAMGSTGLQNYSFTDRKLPKTGMLYYRLEVVDKDGKLSYSKIETVKLKQSFEFSLTQTKYEAVLNLGDVNGLVSVKVSDANGRTQLQQKQKISSGELIKISTTNLSSGIYFVTVEYDGNIQTKRLIK
jgi:ELWxxDGT repeat protein